MMADLGYSEQSQNKYSFFKGPATEAAISKILTNGGEADAFAPFESSNINGIVCLSMINRILYAALGFIGQWDSASAESIVVEDDDLIKKAKNSSWEQLIPEKKDTESRDLARNKKVKVKANLLEGLMDLGEVSGGAGTSTGKATESMDVDEF